MSASAIPPTTPISPVPIAIVGIGCRLPGGANSAEAFWELLCNGTDAVSEVPPERWDLGRHFDPSPQRPLHQHVRHGGFVDGIDQFDPAFFGITPREALCMDPQQRLLLEVAWQAVEDAGHPLEAMRGRPVGVFMGISSSDYSSLLWASEEDFAIPDNEPFVLPGNTGCIAANRLSYFFDFKGPSFTVDTACSSSLVAVHLACESIWQGESEAALVGGVQALIQPGIQSIFCKAGLLAPDGRCKSFDAAANGYVRSEGAGAVLLKPLAAAQAAGDAIYAVIHGTAVNSDGRSNGMVAPNLRAQVACVRQAFAKAGIAPATTQYVEAHGTGTRQGDPIELRALGTVLGEGRDPKQPCRVGSVKTNLGHSETAAGITGLIKAALCVHHRQLPPSLHFRTPNPAIDFAGLKLKVQTSLEPFPIPTAPAVVGVSSFGFGGTNAHVVMAEAPAQAPRARYGPAMPLQLLTLSARSEVALRAQVSQLLLHLEQQPRLALADVCATANQHRSQFSRRLVVLATTREQLVQQLQAWIKEPDSGSAQRLVSGQASRTPGKICFLFTGQGSQLPGMAQELQAQHPVFREAFERCTAVLDPLLPQPLSELIVPPADASPDQLAAATELLEQTRFAQPALFAVEYALTRLWASWGVEPDLLLGHSVGELVAAHLAGVMSLDDALRMVEARARLMQALPSGGGMLAVLAGEAEIAPLLSAELALAALNGPANTVVSGPLVALEALEQKLAQQGIQATRLAVSHAFHSPMMAPMLAGFEQELSSVRFTPPQRALVSNLSGRLAGAEVASAEYWCEHVMAPVRFAEGMATAAAQGALTFVEVGPRPTLIGMGRQCLPEGHLAWWPSLRPGQSDWSVLLGSLAQLHGNGHSVNWRGFHEPFAQRRVPLPGYPFQRQRYWWPRLGEAEAQAGLWLEQIKGKPGLSPGSSGRQVELPPSKTNGPALGELEPINLPGGREQRWRIWLAAGEPQDLADHRLRDQVVFPAAGFILLALQVQALDGQPLRLVQLQLDKPLRLHQDAIELQLVKGAVIEWHSASGLERCWVDHGCCLPDPHGMLGGAPVWHPPAAEARSLDLDPFYAALASFGLAYGPAFRSLVRLERTAEQAWGWLERPAGAADWALLDGCFQAVAATIDPEAAAGQVFLPVGLEQLDLQALPLPERLRCRVQLQPSSEPAFVLADLTLYGDADEAIGCIKGFRLRRLPRQALDWLFPLPQAEQTPALPVHQAWLSSSDWTPLPERSPVAAPEDLLLLWPEQSSSCTIAARLAELLTTAQQEPSGRPIWLVIEGEGALQGALAGFARTAAFERSGQQWLRLHVPAGQQRELLPIEQIAAWASEEPALRVDGERLLAQRLYPLPPARFRLAIGQFGVLETLVPEPCAAQRPGTGELEVAVEATGLNFRDVLNALGALRSYSRELGLDEAARVPFGGECVGRVTAVGAGVDPALVGQRVLAALAVGSLASHVVCRAELCVAWPEHLPVELGASLSTAFLTAIHGLQRLAELKAGDTVLIHAAAGGVGQAAVQVARRCGARVLATASAGKQAALLEQGVEAVFDSRSLAFADAVLEITDGRGVDVVLNSLKGDWVDASFRALAAGGRFVELGKIEVWSREKAAAQRPDASYLPFDLLEVAAAEPLRLRELLEQFVADFQAGRYQPLPLQSLPLSQCEDAFRLMAQGRHVGKLVISQGERLQPRRIAANQSVLVSGALGGIGLQLLPWLEQRGARELLLVARSAQSPSPEARLVLEALEARGVRVVPIACNLATADPLERTAALKQLEAALESAGPVAGVFHAAGVLDDGLIDRQTSARLDAVLAPKWRGWQLLEEALAQRGQSPWVVQFSSVAALLGSPGQVAYSAANGALDGLASRSARQLAIQWGPWQGGGMAGQLDGRQQQRLQALGLASLAPDQALDALGDLLDRGAHGVVAVMDADWERLASQAGGRGAAPLQPLVLAQQRLEDANGEVRRRPAYLELLESTPLAERPEVLRRFVREQLAKVMGLADADEIDTGEPLFNLGLDSLMALELMVLLEQNLGIRLTEALVFEHPTIDALVVHFLRELFPADVADAARPQAPALNVAQGDWDAQVSEVASQNDDALLKLLQGGR